MGNTSYPDWKIKFLLSLEPESEFKLEEDLLIDQGDGTKACFNWELRGKGFSLMDLQKKYNPLETMSDEELLRDAYKQAGIPYKKY